MESIHLFLKPISSLNRLDVYRKDEIGYSIIYEFCIDHFSSMTISLNSVLILVQLAVAHAGKEVTETYKNGHVEHLSSLFMVFVALISCSFLADFSGS